MNCSKWLWKWGPAEFGERCSEELHQNNVLAHWESKDDVANVAHGTLGTNPEPGLQLDANRFPAFDLGRAAASDALPHGGSSGTGFVADGCGGCCVLVLWS